MWNLAVTCETCCVISIVKKKKDKKDTLWRSRKMIGHYDRLSHSIWISRGDEFVVERPAGRLKN